MKKKKLGEVLRERGHISPTNLAKAIAEQQEKVVLLGELLLEQNLVTKDQMASALEAVTNIPYVDCMTVSADPAALRRITQQLARRCLALPIAQQGSKLVVVMAEPRNLTILDELKYAAGTNVSPRFGFRDVILQGIIKHYGVKGGPEAADSGADHEEVAHAEMEFISTSSRQANQEAIQEAQAELLHRRTPAVKVVSEVIRAASEKRASDIHIEPQAKGVFIRLRVDGVLRDLQRVPRAMQNTLISRIKILSDMDIAERRTPQDGRFMVRIGSSTIDMRVSTLPTQYGEKVVMRLLNSEHGIVNLLDQLSMPDEVETSLRQFLTLPQGMLLVTGPTGSGKSTTLYTALNLLRRPSVNIVTVEDPVEYVLPGINQVHVNNKAGLTFVSCLRSILRQDPNVIMIGEIRDKETSEIAMKAAQTGHLVLSTLHTNDSFSAVTRMLDLGIPGFMVASSVSAIMAQRLVRRLCDCRRESAVSSESHQRLVDLGMVKPMETVYVPVGCSDCDQTGYRGRVGVYEILMFNEVVREAIRNGQTSEDLRGIMRGMGMKLMQEDALVKIQEGITSVEEVARVVPVQTIDVCKVCTHCENKIVRNVKFCPHCGAKQSVGKTSSGGRHPKLAIEEPLEV
jgi:type IV pilus assembly protein PilB